jgi:hypothetical protein
VTVICAVLATLLALAVAVLVVLAVVASRRELMRRADEQVDASLADRLLGGVYAEKVMVTRSAGEAFLGVLADMDDRMLLLREAQAVGADGQRRSVDGELLIPRADVAYIQRP